MEKIAYTVQPSSQPSLNDWMTEFRCGIQRPNLNDRASDMMKQWVDEKFQLRSFKPIIDNLNPEA